jgi:hypothetical protein
MGGKRLLAERQERADFEPSLAVLVGPVSAPGWTDLTHAPFLCIERVGALWNRKSAMR